ncbi:calcium-transporting ATPase 12, plasma membrane-type-like [Bidens hawaiensis]|uniref:calcium-transporting ATPase 12, plasma membrane-type-like n=1 Tax=Bidens hawaiensis TaxID=980011 RepID=UPI00404A83CD
MCQNPEVAETSDSLAASPEHHITIGQPEKCIQIKSISKIVLQKNFQSLHAFGGLSGVQDALGTDFDKGISHEEALHRQQELSLNRASTHTFLHLVWEEVKKKTVLLLFLVVALSIVFEIDEEGLQYGLIDGAVVFSATVLQVLFLSIHKYRKERRARKKLQKQQLEEGSVREVHVIRGGDTKDISESGLVYGDILLLKKDCQVPADGLFVDGEDLELGYGSESYITNKQKPFLSYGERVISGNARMVVTSTHMMRRKGACDPNARFKLERQLDKLNVYMNYIRIIINILIIVVLFLRFTLGKMDDDYVYRPESMAEPTGIRSFSNAFEKIIKESKYTTKGLTKLLCVSLVGLTEGVPFAVSLAIVYWNEEALSSKAIEQDSHGILKMASVTKICTDTFGEFAEDDTEVQMLCIGGEFSEGRKLASNVVEALCDGIGASKDNAYLHGGNSKLGLNRERMKQIPQTEENDEMTLHLNGPVNEIMSKCTHYYNIQGEKVSMNEQVRRDFGQANDKMECVDKLTTSAVACKHTDNQTHDAEDWVLVALLGLKHKDMKAEEAEVKALKECGIEIIIVSNKKLPVLKDLALRDGLITDSDPQNSVLAAKDFRNCSDKERLEIVKNIRVLGEAFSSDKLLLVETLRQKGEVVVFLGQKTDEVPALMGADISITMGRRSTEKARESSDIIMWDWSFSEISIMVNSGKCISKNIQSFLQPVLITTISSTVISLIQTTAWGDASLTTIQSVYVNLAVLFLGGFALLTKASADKPVSLDPVSCGRSLITAHMTRNILVQVSYQVTCLVIIQTKGPRIVGSSQNMKTVLFNLFIICQFFNLFIAREIQKMNFFRCIHRHIKFWAAITVFMVLHAIFVAVQDILGYGPILNWKLWAGCVLVGVLSWLVDWIAKCISWFIKEFVNRFCKTLY